MEKLKAVIMADNEAFYNGDIIDYVYGNERLNYIRDMTDLYPVRVTSENFEEEILNLRDIEVIFSTWGMLKLTYKQLDYLPNLKIVFYAAGSTQAFAVPFLERGVTLCSAVKANAIPVAEFCLAQIILSMKGAYRNSQLCKKGPWVQGNMPVGRGFYDETIALIGIGEISRHLLYLLKPFRVNIIAVSGYLSRNPQQAKEIGIDRIVTIEEAFKEAYVISNHLPNKIGNRGVITKKHFESMREGATFINTGRGAQVNEVDLIEVLKARQDLTALLDVQQPEPPNANSELYLLSNVHMTSHIAGSNNNEVRRMADFMIEDFKRWINNEPLKYIVNGDELSDRA